MKPEHYYGNIEYKLKVTNKSRDRLDQLTTQLRFRMSEGGGECTYHLGIQDDGSVEGITDEEYNETLLYLDDIARSCNYTITSIYEKDCDNYKSKGSGKSNKKIYELLIRENNSDKYIDIRVAVTGSVDAGKSTLLGVLTAGYLDDGRGKARTSILNYPHEQSSGRTSSIAHHILGFDDKGNTVNNDRLGKMTWPEIVRRSRKVINFNDLCGHEKYLKTTILGLSSTFPDLCFIIVGANMGLNRMTQEHIFLCLTLKIPFVVIITKMDIVKHRKNVYEETMEKLYSLLRLPSIRRAPYKVKNRDDIFLCAEKLHHNSLVPIFHVSNVDGDGIDNLKMFLNLTKKRKKNYNNDDPVEYHIDKIYKNIKGVGLVVGGNLVTGTLKTGDKLLIGPDNNTFEPVLVRSLQCKRVPIDKVDFGTYVCIGLRNVDKDKIRKGNVIVSPKINPTATVDFEAEIKVLKSHATTVKEGYEAVIHTCSIRQTGLLVKILSKDSDRKEIGKSNIIRVGDKGIVLFRFKYRPEFIKVGYRLFLSEGKTKIIGEVTKLHN